MTHIINHPDLGDLEDIARFAPPGDTHAIEKYLLQVIDDLHRDPWAHRAIHKCPSRRLKIISFYRGWQGIPKSVPRINLMGNWLSSAGFGMEQYVRVFPLQKALVICPDEEYI